MFDCNITDGDIALMHDGYPIMSQRTCNGSPLAELTNLPKFVGKREWLTCGWGLFHEIGEHSITLYTGWVVDAKME